MADKHVVGGGSAQVDGHAGERVQRGGGRGVGNAVAAHAAGLIHPEGQAGVQRHG